MITSLRFRLAAWLDRKEAQIRRVGERVGWPQGWLQEWIEYSQEPRLPLEEFYVLYTLKRQKAQKHIRAVKTEADALAFYRDSDYMLWRNLVHRRHSAWRRVLVTMRIKNGGLVEVGCGIAPISTWVVRRKPRWHCLLRDVHGSPHYKYALWRMKRLTGHHVQDMGQAQVVCLIDVLEHVSDPLKLSRQWVDFLAPGGYLHWNFVGNPRRNDLDLATPEQRDKTVRYLYDALDLVWEGEGYRVSRKR